MTRMLLALLALSAAALAQVESSAPKHKYEAPRGNHVTVHDVGAQRESRIEFFGPGDKRACTADYTSSDGSHGFVVGKAEWTPDGRYFVYSMTSSGGHQPWHSPTEFFDRDDHQLCHLDQFFGSSGVATPDFKLSAPNTVTTALDLSMRPVTASLDELQKANKLNTGRCVPCNAGVVHEFGDKTPYEHSPN